MFQLNQFTCIFTMVELRNYFFVWLFCILIQKNIHSCSADNCLNLKLQPSQKLNLEFFFQSEYAKGIDDVVCPVLLKYKDKLTLKFKISPLTKGTVGALTCPNDKSCDSNRYLACVHKGVNGAIDKCVDLKTLTFDNIGQADCFCHHETDDILLQNAKDWAALKLSDDKVPTLILNGSWDPCLDVSSTASFEKYVYNIYH